MVDPSQTNTRKKNISSMFKQEKRLNMVIVKKYMEMDIEISFC